MQMHWPSDGPGTDLEITGAGPHHLPDGQLWAVDDQGTPYAVRFEGGSGRGETAAWRGVARLSPVPGPALGGWTWSATESGSSGCPSGPRPRGRLDAAREPFATTDTGARRWPGRAVGHVPSQT